MAKKEVPQNREGLPSLRVMGWLVLLVCLLFPDMPAAIHEYSKNLQSLLNDDRLYDLDAHVHMDEASTSTTLKSLKAELVNETGGPPMYTNYSRSVYREWEYVSFGVPWALDPWRKIFYLSVAIREDPADAANSGVYETFYLHAADRRTGLPAYQYQRKANGHLYGMHYDLDNSRLIGLEIDSARSFTSWTYKLFRYRINSANSTAPFMNYTSDTIDFSATYPYGTTYFQFNSITAIASLDNAYVFTISDGSTADPNNLGATKDVCVWVNIEDGAVLGYSVLDFKDQTQDHLKNHTFMVFRNNTGLIREQPPTIFDFDLQNYTHYDGFWGYLDNGTFYANAIWPNLYNEEPTIPLSLPVPQFNFCRYDLEAETIQFEFEEETLMGASQIDTDDDIVPDYVDNSTSLFENYANSTFTCTDLFTDATCPLLPASNVAHYINFVNTTRLVAYLPYEFIIQPYDILQIRPDRLYALPINNEWSPASEDACQIDLPDPLYNPIINLTGNCDPITNETSGMWNYSVTCYLKECDATTFESLSNHSDHNTLDQSKRLEKGWNRWQFPDYSLEIATVYTINLTVETLFFTNHTEIFKVEKMDYALPVVTISNDNFTWNRTEELVVTPDIVIDPNCPNVKRTMSWEWQQLTGDLDLSPATFGPNLGQTPFPLDQQNLTIPAYTLTPLETYLYETRSYPPGAAHRNDTANVTFTILRSDVFVAFAQANRTIVRGDVVAVDVRTSIDPDYPTSNSVAPTGNFTYSCVAPNGTDCFDGASAPTNLTLATCQVDGSVTVTDNAQSFASPQFRVTNITYDYCLFSTGLVMVDSAVLEPGVYYFTVTFEAPFSKTSAADGYFTISVGTVPTVTMSLSPSTSTKLAATSAIRVTGTVDTSTVDPNTSPTYSWEMYANSSFGNWTQIPTTELNVSDTSQFTTTSASSIQTLTILANTLNYSTVYNVRLVITADYQSGYAEIDFTTAGPPPSGGTFSVDPSNGTSVDARTFSASGWTADDLPLTYLFYYEKLVLGETTRVNLTSSPSSTTSVNVSGIPVGEAPSYVLTTYLDVYTSFGASTTSVVSIFSFPPTDVDGSVTNLLTQAASQTADEVPNTLQTALTTLDASYLPAGLDIRIGDEYSYYYRSMTAVDELGSYPETILDSVLTLSNDIQDTGTPTISSVTNKASVLRAVAIRGLRNENAVTTVEAVVRDGRSVGAFKMDSQAGRKLLASTFTVLGLMMPGAVVGRINDSPLAVTRDASLGDARGNRKVISVTGNELDYNATVADERTSSLRAFVESGNLTTLTNATVSDTGELSGTSVTANTPAPDINTEDRWASDTISVISGASGTGRRRRLETQRSRGTGFTSGAREGPSSLPRLPPRLSGPVPRLGDSLEDVVSKHVLSLSFTSDSLTEREIEETVGEEDEEQPTDVPTSTPSLPLESWEEGESASAYAETEEGNMREIEGERDPVKEPTWSKEKEEEEERPDENDETRQRDFHEDKTGAVQETFQTQEEEEGWAKEDPASLGENGEEEEEWKRNDTFSLFETFSLKDAVPEEEEEEGWERNDTLNLRQGGEEGDAWKTDDNFEEREDEEDEQRISGTFSLQEREEKQQTNDVPVEEERGEPPGLHAPDDVLARPSPFPPLYTREVEEKAFVQEGMQQSPSGPVYPPNSSYLQDPPEERQRKERGVHRIRTSQFDMWEDVSVWDTSHEVRKLQLNATGERGVYTGSATSEQWQRLEQLELIMLEQAREEEKRSEIQGLKTQEELQELELFLQQSNATTRNTERQAVLSAIRAQEAATTTAQATQVSRTNRLLALRDQLSLEVLDFMRVDEMPVTFPTPGFDVIIGKTNDLSNVQPQFTFATAAPSSSAPAGPYSYVFTEFLKKQRDGAASTPKGNATLGLTLKVLDSNNNEISVSGLDSPLRLFSDVAAFAGGLCLAWDDLTDSWKGTGLLTDGQGCLSTHLTDIAMFLDSEVFAQALVEAEPDSTLTLDVNQLSWPVIALLCALVAMNMLAVGWGYWQDWRQRITERKKIRQHKVDGDGLEFPLSPSDPIAYHAKVPAREDEVAGEEALTEVERRRRFLLFFGLTLWNVAKRDHFLLAPMTHCHTFTRPQKLTTFLAFTSGMLAFNSFMLGERFVDSAAIFPLGALCALCVYPLLIGLIALFAKRPTPLKHYPAKRKGAGGVAPLGERDVEALHQSAALDVGIFGGAAGAEHADDLRSAGFEPLDFGPEGDLGDVAAQWFPGDDLPDQDAQPPPPPESDPRPPPQPPPAWLMPVQSSSGSLDEHIHRGRTEAERDAGILRDSEEPHPFQALRAFEPMQRPGGGGRRRSDTEMYSDQSDDDNVYTGPPLPPPAPPPPFTSARDPIPPPQPNRGDDWEEQMVLMSSNRLHQSLPTPSPLPPFIPHDEEFEPQPPDTEGHVEGTATPPEAPHPDTSVAQWPSLSFEDGDTRHQAPPPPGGGDDETEMAGEGGGAKVERLAQQATRMLSEGRSSEHIESVADRFLYETRSARDTASARPENDFIIPGRISQQRSQRQQHLHPSTQQHRAKQSPRSRKPPRAPGPPSRAPSPSQGPPPGRFEGQGQTQRGGLYGGAADAPPPAPASGDSLPSEAFQPRRLDTRGRPLSLSLDSPREQGGLGLFRAASASPQGRSPSRSPTRSPPGRTLTRSRSFGPLESLGGTAAGNREVAEQVKQMYLARVKRETKRTEPVFLPDLRPTHKEVPGWAYYTMLILPFAATMLIICFACFIVVIYGMFFDSDRTRRWWLAFMSAFLLSALVTDVVRQILTTISEISRFESRRKRWREWLDAAQGSPQSLHTPAGPFSPASAPQLPMQPPSTSPHGQPPPPLPEGPPPSGLVAPLQYTQGVPAGVTGDDGGVSPPDAPIPAYLLGARAADFRAAPFSLPDPLHVQQQRQQRGEESMDPNAFDQELRDGWNVRRESAYAGGARPTSAEQDPRTLGLLSSALALGGNVPLSPMQPPGGTHEFDRPQSLHREPGGAVGDFSENQMGGMGEEIEEGEVYGAAEP
uniref:PKD/REJ-like domain-containing protein n=1 Tax=Chromera velia CCMP2878 TaxID=1169474 RepID=A0A0G4FT19_9ALVE|eukprot:Cvel_18592.t1-p1 / transcript=Cvel_18592.t1 / gene=Cvel_18592 / organism=Chromera_velia_CCMP2878 / gene_product=Serine-rich adhesin for platelets, putative / transcript_product=Serine-rich adhesin for platelets, putative / location=Cvel_scaffold1551:9175-28499(-) / protein_length=3013 / sequence_SO=supercontig / SO=protein_coding / is_pseudo=false